MKTKTYKLEEIFQKNTNNENDILMNIPPEVLEEMNWMPGDKLKIKIGDQGTIMITKVEHAKE